MPRSLRSRWSPIRTSTSSTPPGTSRSLDPTTGSPDGPSRPRAAAWPRSAPTKIYLRSYNLDLFVVDRATGRMVVDPSESHLRAGLNLREYDLDIVNRFNDRIYFATRSGIDPRAPRDRAGSAAGCFATRSSPRSATSRRRASSRRLRAAPTPGGRARAHPPTPGPMRRARPRRRNRHPQGQSRPRAASRAAGVSAR